jgi:predicted esterase
MRKAGLLVIFAVWITSARVSADQSHDSIGFSEYADMRARVGELYEQKRYQEGIEILKSHLNKFPDKLHANAYNLALFYVHQKQHANCFEVLEHALDKGAWFGQGDFEHEAWGPIRDTKRLYRIKARSDSLRQRAKKKTISELLVITPQASTSEQKYPLFIALHGGSSDVEIFKNAWKSHLLNTEFVVAYVQSSQLVSMNSFWWEDATTARRDVARAYRKVIEQYAIDTEQVVIGGFSSGGKASLDIALSGTIPVTGFVVLCPAPPETSFTPRNVRVAKQRGMRGTIITTEMEPDQRIYAQKKMIELFKVEGLQYQFIVIPSSGHWIPDDIGSIIDIAIRHIQSK